MEPSGRQWLGSFMQNQVNVVSGDKSFPPPALRGDYRDLYNGNVCPVLGKRGEGRVPPLTPPTQNYPSAKVAYFWGGLHQSSSKVCFLILFLWDTFPRVLSEKYMCILLFIDVARLRSKEMVTITHADTAV